MLAKPMQAARLVAWPANDLGLKTKIGSLGAPSGTERATLQSSKLIADCLEGTG